MRAIERQKRVREYRGQIASPGRPTIAWREDRVRFWIAIAGGAKTVDAGIAAGVSQPVAHRWFKHAGGVNPQLPPSVSGRYISSSEREDIALWRAQGEGVREIARRLGRSPSTISRELRRNASTRTYRLEYKASTAQWHAERRARRPRVAKMVINGRLREYVQDRLSGEVHTTAGKVVGPDGPSWDGKNKPHRGDRAWVTGWSPEQISKRLPLDFPDDESMRISAEAIYQALYIESRGGLERMQSWHLWRGRTKRMPRSRARQQTWAHVTADTVLAKRPKEVADRKLAGHWEGDLIIGLKRSAVATLIERTSPLRGARPSPSPKRIRGDSPEEKRPSTGRLRRLDHERRPDQGRHPSTENPQAVFDMGSRQGTLSSCTLHRTDRCPSIFR